MFITDILGPIMVGPSSSHTAGAVKIGYIAGKLLGSDPVKVKIGLHGSFSDTGRGHGTDRALIAGVMGMKWDDIDIPISLSIAAERKLEFSFEKISLRDAHPNTALLQLWDGTGREIQVQASSLGGGRILVTHFNGIHVNFDAENPTIVIQNMDAPGVIASVSAYLSGLRMNIAAMQVYRDKSGGHAATILQLDKVIKKNKVQALSWLEGIEKVTYIDGFLEYMQETEREDVISVN